MNKHLIQALYLFSNVIPFVGYGVLVTTWFFHKEKADGYEARSWRIAIRLSTAIHLSVLMVFMMDSLLSMLHSGLSIAFYGYAIPFLIGLYTAVAWVMRGNSFRVPGGIA